MTSLFTAVSASVIPPLYLASIGRYAAKAALEQGSLVRVSPGPAFWLALFITVPLLADVWQRGRSAERFFLILAVTMGACVAIALFITGFLDDISIVREYSVRRNRFFVELQDHILLTFSAVTAAMSVGIPLGILAQRRQRLGGPLFFLLNFFQTIPSLALFGILIPVLAAIIDHFPVLTEAGIHAIGTPPAFIALTVYSLLPLARNTYAGFTSVDEAVVDAGRGMGMSPFQLFLRVELPIASPIILSGIRIALVQATGLTAVAALIGAGGLGVFIFQGLGQAATDLILLGAVPTIVLAVALDGLMNSLIHLIEPERTT